MCQAWQLGCSGDGFFRILSDDRKIAIVHDYGPAYSDVVPATCPDFNAQIGYVPPFDGIQLGAFQASTVTLGAHTHITATGNSFADLHSPYYADWVAESSFSLTFELLHDACMTLSAQWESSDSGSLYGGVDADASMCLDGVCPPGSAWAMQATLGAGPHTVTIHATCNAFINFIEPTSGGASFSITIDLLRNDLLGPEDLNGDGVVDGADMGFLLSEWGSTDSVADLNGDGTVDSADLGLLLAGWGCPKAAAPPA
ncbi:MAG: hypothetical protein U0575_01050 [Phycisphaerales bacterium]